MPDPTTDPDFPIWPSEIGVKPPRAGRFSLTLSYRAGLDKARTSYWVEPEYEAALQRLVDAVTTTRGAA
jgi:hypothetical protein